jgi:hypothetical protein
MKSEFPMKLECLSDLVSNCETLCRSECCGIDAYDFSPINIANYLTKFDGQANESEVDLIKEKLKFIISSNAQNSEPQLVISVEEMNQNFTSEEIVIFASEIKHNLEVALFLVSESDKKRFKNSLFAINRNRYLLKKRHPSAIPENNS